MLFMFFFFNDTATTEIYTLSLHDALPIFIDYATQRGLDVIPEIDMPGHFSAAIKAFPQLSCNGGTGWGEEFRHCRTDRKSTRLNSSHANISYAVFCLKKKNNMISISNIVK